MDVSCLLPEHLQLINAVPLELLLEHWISWLFSRAVTEMDALYCSGVEEGPSWESLVWWELCLHSFVASGNARDH